MRKGNRILFLVVLALCILFGYSIRPLSVSASEIAFVGNGSTDAPWIISATPGSDDVRAWLKEDGADGYILYIEGKGRMIDSFRNVEAPWKEVKQKINAVEIGERITNVGAYAFDFCRGLTRVLLPESLTEIGTYAFHSTGVKHLIIPANVDTIGRMIANPTTYYEVLGNPSSVNNHAFSTSLVSVPDQASAEALNPQTDVLAIIVLNGGIYGESDSDLANLSYGLIEPKKEGFLFDGWYQSADFTGQRCIQDSRGRTAVNINHIYYAKWTEAVVTPTPTPEPTPEPTASATLTPSPRPTEVVPNPGITPQPTNDVTPSPEPTEPAEVSPIPGIPLIKNEFGKKGWDIIKEEIEKTEEGDTVTVDMNGITELRGDVIDSIKGRDITVVFELGNNLIWSVNGTSITEDKIANIDLKVEINTTHIPDNMVQEVAQGGDSTQLSLSYNGGFGFTAMLSINMGKNNRGRDAVLYYYNRKNKEMEQYGEDRVDQDGWVMFPFTHASDYVIVLSKTQSPEPTISAAPTPEPTPSPEITPVPTPTDTIVPTPQLSLTPAPTKEPASSIMPTAVPTSPKVTLTPVPTMVQDSEPTLVPVSSGEPTPEITLTPEPTKTEPPEATKEPSITEEPSVTEAPSDVTDQPETPTLTEAPQSPTQSATASGTPETEKGKGFNWMIPVGIVAAGAAIVVIIVLTRRKSGGKK